MRRVWTYLYFWVLIAIVIGLMLGLTAPGFAQSLRPIGDGFIDLIRMLIGPIVFCTVVMGIAGAGDMKRVGRIGVKALVYFEVMSTFALLLGLLVANTLKPGRGFNAQLETLDASIATPYTQTAAHLSVSDFFSHLIPRTFFSAFTGEGDLLQILLLALLVGWAMNRIGVKAQPVLKVIEGCSAILFTIINGIMKLAPLGAGAAMAFTIGKFGYQAILPLFGLVGAFYLTSVLFVLLVLGAVSAWAGFSILKFLRYIRAELLLVLGTSSSETALVPLMEKLERLGCSKSVVGMVVPAGYSFNLDGTNIYLTLSALFIAQAFNVDLSLSQQIELLLVAMLTSKGASGVTGAGFITLAATLAVVPQVPATGLALLLGIDRFMSEARALTNTVGNGVATLVIARWENLLDEKTLKYEISQREDLGLGDPDRGFAKER